MEVSFPGKNGMQLIIFNFSSEGKSAEDPIRSVRDGAGFKNKLMGVMVYF